MYHREFKKLSVAGSNTAEAQMKRFEDFLTKVQKVRNASNTLILGDFNINLNSDDDNLN